MNMISDDEIIDPTAIIGKNTLVEEYTISSSRTQIGANTYKNEYRA